MALQLITENLTEVKTLKEDKDAAPKYFIEGIFMQGNLKNQNGRVYPSRILATEMARYGAEKITKRNAFGELGHPDGPNINMDRVSHIITELRQDGDNFYGRAKVIDTPMGRIVRTFIDEGSVLGVSSRGLGSLRESADGIMEVQDDFMFSTVDVVADPSAPAAFVRGILEGKQWVWDSGILKEQAIVKMAAVVEAAHNPNVRSDIRKETFRNTFKQFLTALSEGTESKVTLR